MNPQNEDIKVDIISVTTEDIQVALDLAPEQTAQIEGWLVRRIAEKMGEQLDEWYWSALHVIAKEQLQNNGILPNDPEYRGVDVIATAPFIDPSEFYISFGEWKADTDCDSYGVPDNRIMEYVPYEEFMKAVCAPSPQVRGYRILSYKLVPKDEPKD